MEDDLEWLADLPEPWRPPAELAVPTPNRLVNLLVLVSSSRYAFNALVERSALLVAERERFNQWVLTEGKGSLSDREFVMRSAETEAVLRDCWQAWSEYVRAWEGDERPAAAVYAQVLEVFERGAEVYRVARRPDQ